MTDNRREKISQQRSSFPAIKGGSTSLILRGLDLAKNTPIIVLDVKTAMAHRDRASLKALNDTKILINQYVEVLLPLKGEKKIVAEQAHQKNQKIDSQLIEMEKKQIELENQYQEFKKLKKDFEVVTTNPTNRTNLLEDLKIKSSSYRKEVEKFNKQVQQIQFNLEHLKRDIKFHASLDMQRKIEQPITIHTESPRSLS